MAPDNTTRTAEAGITNRVANSGILTLDLEQLRPDGPRSSLDLKERLHMGLVLREKDLRDWAEQHDWTTFAGHHVALFCSADAIVPAWPYMLLATRLRDAQAASVHLCPPEQLEQLLLLHALDHHNWAQYANARVVLKGCGSIGPAEYARAAWHLQPLALKIMYGEPCSMVPISRRQPAHSTPAA